MIDKTAIISEGALISKNVSIGPFVVIEDGVIIGENTKILCNCILKRNTVIGKNNYIYENAIIGGDPQDISFDPAIQSHVEIGDFNIIREHVTIHRSTKLSSPTKIGNKNYIMVNAHIAHDNLIGNHTIITNSVNFGGHVMVEDFAVIGGAAQVHQHVRIGKMSMVAGMAPVSKDVIPFMLLGRNPAKHYSLNLIGLRRNNVSKDSIKEIRIAINDLRKNGTLSETINFTSEEVGYLKSWLSTNSHRGCHSFL
jgi:UDP-N-acetylglucosamine acyltransferase